MSTNLQYLLRNSLLNNTYDYKSVNETLDKTWVNSYSYLYHLQKSYIEFEHLKYNSGDTSSREIKDIGHLYLNKSHKVCFDINYDFIDVCDREAYKHSKFYNSTFEFTDMTDNSDIFYKIPIILIDNKAIWDYSIRINHNSMTIILPFDRKFIIEPTRNKSTDEIIYIDHDIQFFIVDNILYKRVKINRSEIGLTKGSSDGRKI